MKLRFRVLEGRPSQLPLPGYQTDGASGLDVASAVALSIAPGAWARVGTGLAVEIPPGLEIQVRPRSGLAAKHGVTVLNAPGTIDSDYRGEIQVLLINHGPEPFGVAVGDRIAQLVVSSVVRVAVEASTEATETTRGTGGFGHTGR